MSRLCRTKVAGFKRTRSGFAFFCALALFVTVCGTELRAAPPFYLTVERSFSTTERPQVRIDFTNQSVPLALKILRPKDLDTFLDGQLNLSRAYEEPRSDINPGHYLAKGFNLVRSPLPVLRSFINEHFRAGFGGTKFNAPLKPDTAGDLFSTPQEIRIGAPAGFDLVREEFIDLQKGGEVAKALYDWSESYFGRYQVREIALDPLSDGVYLIQATQGRAQAQALLQVSSLAVQLKQSSDQILVRVMNRALQPVPGATVAYRDSRGKWIPISTQTDQNGELLARSADGFDNKLLVKVANGSAAALVETDFLPTTVKADETYIVTDRPIFKPGETFYYKGTVRTPEKGGLSVPKFEATSAKVRLVQSDGTDTGLSETVPLTSFGSFSGSFGLSELQIPGVYRVESEIGERKFAGELRVRDYVKPTYYLELVERDPVLRPGSTFNFRFRARRYAGGTPRGVKYEVFVYRKRFEAPQWVKEAGSGLEAGEDYYGVTRDAGALTQPLRVYSSIEKRSDASEGNPWSTAPEVADDGSASVSIDLPQITEAQAANDWIYTVMVRAVDLLDEQAVLAENIYVTQSDAVVSARFSNVLYDSGALPTVELRSTLPSGQPAAQTHGAVVISSRSPNGMESTLESLAFVTDSLGVARATLSKAPPPGLLLATASATALGDKPFTRPFTAAPTSSVVAGAPGAPLVNNEALELRAEKTILVPGEKARILALLPKNWGTKEAGNIWRTIGGREIFENGSEKVQGRSVWFETQSKPEYGSGFYYTVNVPVEGGHYQEQSIGFRVVPEDKRLTIKINPAAPETEPLAPFQIGFSVVDSRGQPAPQTELSVNVVDRAVYAVQPEFRPGILEFFFPLPRLNVGTFYSDELQGYGYSEELLKPNFKLTALKSQSAPVKRGMRDTAGWFPHVVTDEKGFASVTVDMPANITEWVVTAIAADMQGRVGEGKGMFRSRSDVEIELRAPQFVRLDDELHGAVEAINQSDSPITLALHVDQGVVGNAHPVPLAIDAHGQNRTPIMLRGGSEASLVRIGIDAPPNIKHGGAREFTVHNASAALPLVLSGHAVGATVSFELPKEGTISQLRVRVVSGLLGAALSAAHELVSYPYGCSEQLVHSTIPNLLLLELVKSAGLSPELLTQLHLTDSLQKARENAAIGVKRLLLNQKKDGGFSLWNSESSSSFPVTLLVARALRLAVEQGVEGAGRASQSAQMYLTSEATTGGSSDLLSDPFVLELLDEAGLGSRFADQIGMFVSTVVENPERADPYALARAIRLIAHFKDSYWFKENVPKAEPALPLLANGLLHRLQKPNPFAVWPASRAFVDVWGEGVFADESQAVALVLAALHDAGALTPELRAKFSGLLLHALHQGWWGSTYSSGAIIFLLRSLILDEAKNSVLDDRVLAAQTKSGQRLFELTRMPGGFYADAKFPDATLPPSSLLFEGVKPEELILASAFVDVPYRAVTSFSDGLVVSRSLKRITAKGLEPVSAKAVLHVGDVLLNTISLARIPTTLPGSSNFVVLDEGLPALVEAIEEDESYLADAGVVPTAAPGFAIKETRRYPEHVERIFRIEPGARSDIYSVWRVSFGGTAVVPPVRAFDMYKDEISANTTPLNLSAE